MSASRDNSGKAEIDYIFEFPTAVESFCRVKEMGAVKYERGNWKQGGKPDHEYIAAMGRHILAFKRGETFAGDTGCTHLAHAMWNIMALIELNYPDVTHDPELFAKMKAHWQAKKDAAAASDISNWDLSNVKNLAHFFKFMPTKSQPELLKKKRSKLSRFWGWIKSR